MFLPALFFRIKLCLPPFYYAVREESIDNIIVFLTYLVKNAFSVTTYPPPPRHQYFSVNSMHTLQLQNEEQSATKQKDRFLLHNIEIDENYEFLST